MNTEILQSLFGACLDLPYTEIEGGGSFFCQKKKGVLYVFFEKSNGLRDWENNFRFHAEKYEDGGFYCHSGFLKVWKSILPYISSKLDDPEVYAAIIVGYSHGGAVATLCHEYLWRTRSDIRDHIYGYGFGAPRVVWGRVKNRGQIWKNYNVIRNIDDLVTHLPPKVLGYRHVGSITEIGEKGIYSSIDAHREESYTEQLSKTNGLTKLEKYHII